MTARHVESRVASVGDDEAEALRGLADELDRHIGTGDEPAAPRSYLDHLSGPGRRVLTEGQALWMVLAVVAALAAYLAVHGPPSPANRWIGFLVAGTVATVSAYQGAGGGST